jgi:glycosyltransferase involved in cell wall biosynthesis
MSSQFLSRKVLIVATSDSGGAGEAMVKFTMFLQALGHDVRLLVKEKSKNETFIYQYSNRISFIQKNINKILYYFGIFYKKKSILFDDKYCFYALNETKQNIDLDLLSDVLNFQPEYIFSGWTSNFLNSTDLLRIKIFFNAKVYTISTDMNHLTGGCHYAWDCKGYVHGCNSECPAILSKRDKKIAEVNFQTKMKNAKSGDFQIISGSGWILNQAKESLIYKNQIEFLNINSLIDTKIMNPKSRLFAKDFFEFQADKFYILAGSQNANDPRKGFEYLLESLKVLYNDLSEKDRQKVCVIVVSQSNNNSFGEIQFEKKYLKFISDYRLLSLLYQAVDVFVNSSIEDSGPMMVSEAMACGTPVVGFDMGVVNNLVITGFNGYKAKIKDTNELALGIKCIFKLEKVEYNIYSDNCVQYIEEFSSYTSSEKILRKIFEN